MFTFIKQVKGLHAYNLIQYARLLLQNTDFLVGKYQMQAHIFFVRSSKISTAA